MHFGETVVQHGDVRLQRLLRLFGRGELHDRRVGLRVQLRVTSSTHTHRHRVDVTEALEVAAERHDLEVTLRAMSHVHVLLRDEHHLDAVLHALVLYASFPCPVPTTRVFALVHQLRQARLIYTSQKEYAPTSRAVRQLTALHARHQLLNDQLKRLLVHGRSSRIVFAVVAVVVAVYTSYYTFTLHSAYSLGCSTTRES